ncbi:Retron-type RNA-directed DNA polymerase [Psychromonas arctica]|uniref:Retron-type RNA-directed DNA polymerase n=1 Tax=Psychromonas arctica TaxID=168275 RepID=A0ABU9HFG8_9GAMM
MRSLIKLGVSDGLAIFCASGFIKNTSKGPCRSSKTKGISNAFLARQGLMSLKDLWINIHYSS